MAKKIKKKETKTKDTSAVILQKKSEWQKPNCLFCEKDATKEAVHLSAFVRCCDSKTCIKRAKDMAIIAGR